MSDWSSAVVMPLEAVRGIRRRIPEMDIVRVQDVGLSGVDDPTVLEWAAREGCVLMTHDVATIIFYLMSESGKESQCPESSRPAEVFRLAVQ